MTLSAHHNNSSRSYTNILEKIARAIVAQEIWIVGLCAAGSLVSERLLLPTIMLAITFWFIRWLAYKRFTLRTPGDLAILVLLCLVPITLWASASLTITLPVALRLLTGVILFYTIVNWTTSAQRLQMVLSAIVATGLTLALISPLGVQWASGKLPFIPSRIFDFFVPIFSDKINPNVMAGYLVILLPYALVPPLFAWRQMSSFALVLHTIATSLMLPMLVLAQSRGAWIGLCLVLVILPSFRFRHGWVWLLISGLVFFGVVYGLGFSNTMEILATSNTLGGLVGRIEVWSRAVYMIQDFPFTGVGLGMFGQIADVLYPFFQYQPGSIEHAHNLFLQVAVDMGLPGLISWLSFFLVVIITSWNTYKDGRNHKRTWLAGIGAASLCSQIALAAHGLTNAGTWGAVRPAPITWAIWGLAISSFLVYKKELSNESQ